MAVYTVHEPPLRAGAASPEPERFVFVRDGFSFSALLFGALWMLRHRMWLVLLGYVIIVVALSVLLRLYGSTGAALLVWTMLALLLGFEAPTLRRFTLARRGFRTVGIVVGDDLELAERRFFDAWVSKSVPPAAPPGPPARPTSPLMPRGGPDVLGLFPERGTSS